MVQLQGRNPFRWGFDDVNVSVIICCSLIADPFPFILSIVMAVW